MRESSTDGMCFNSPREDESPECIEATLGKGLKRLAEVRKKWDPQNVFRTHGKIKSA